MSQEVFDSEKYDRIIFYNITAKPVQKSFTLTHALERQINLLNILNKPGKSDKKNSIV